jgi:molecular chaperone Hsp33
MTDSPEIVAGGGSWITHGLACGGAVRVVIAEADEVADALREAHHLSPDAARLAAEATVAAFLLSAHAKGGERLTLQLALDRPRCRFVGEVDADHRFRGRLSPSELPAGFDRADLHGLLLAAKHDGHREVYRGVTLVDHASVIGALRGYMRDSAQLHGVLLCAVTVGADGRVLRAAGALLERMPPSGDLPSLDADAFAARFAALEGDGEEAAVQALLEGDLGGERVAILEQRPVFWGCSCSRGRVLDALSGLAPEELRSMADADGGAKVDCHFCNASYALTAAELRELADAAPG